MKSRLLVWSLVGVVVIIGAIVVLTAPKSKKGPEVTPDLLTNEVARAESQLERLVARLDAGRKTAPGSASEAFDEADQLLAEARERIRQAKQATDPAEIRRLLTEGRDTLRKARRAVELAVKPASRRG